MFLCSYHAYSADGAGGEAKRLAFMAAKNRKCTSEDYALGITYSEYKNSIGYNFQSINRSADVFPKVKTDKALFLRDKCDFKFVTNEIGVVFFRELPSLPGCGPKYGHGSSEIMCRV